MRVKIAILLCLLGLITVTITSPRHTLSAKPSGRKHKALAATVEQSPAVAAPEFTVARGFLETATTVELRCATPGATIRYTLDGSEPIANRGSLYAKPVPIDHTAVLRAVAVKPGWTPSRVITHTYVFPSDVVNSPPLKTSLAKHPIYRSQIGSALRAVPSLSLVTSAPIEEHAPAFGAKTNDKGKLVKASIEWLESGGGTGFQEDCGVEYYGGGYSQFAKKSFRLHFRREFGASKLRFPIFAGHEHGLAAVDEFDQLELRSGSHDMVERGFYLSNIFADDSMLEMGRLNPHGRFVHLYLNGVYWGVFHLRERWGADMHRRYLGGSSSDYEAINGNLNLGGWAPGVPYDGNGRTWTQVRKLRGSYKALSPWVDIPDYIDFMILWIFGRCEDEYRCVGPAVPGSGFKFYLNDADGFFQSPAHPWYGEPSDRTGRNSPGTRGGDGPGSIFSMLLAEADPDFRTLLADRIYKAYFNDGVLTFTSVSNRLKTRCDEFEKAFVAEAARWPYRTPDNWRAVRDDVFAHWLPTRTEAVLAKMRTAGFYPSVDAPRLNQQGGKVTNGFQFHFERPRKGAVYFTVDGSDPRLSGGGVAPSARPYAPPGQSIPDTSPRIDRNTVIKARVLDRDQWSALNEVFFQTVPVSGPTAKAEIIKLRFDSRGKDGAEYVEVSNVSPEAINLRGARFLEGIDYKFADNRDAVLAPGQKFLLVKDLFRFHQHRGLEPAVEGVYTRKKKKDDPFLALSLESGQVIKALINQAAP